VVGFLFCVGVFAVKVVVVCPDLFNGYPPGLLGLLPVGEAVGLAAPPGDLPLELLETHGLGLAVVLVALWIGKLVVSIFGLIKRQGFSSHRLFEEKQRFREAQRAPTAAHQGFYAQTLIGTILGAPHALLRMAYSFFGDHQANGLTWTTPANLLKSLSVE
jgi:hypothetical protein